MNSVNILHFGDMHFDTPFSEGTSSYKERRQEDLRETFGRIIDEAESSKTDIILMSGDLFDNATVMKNTVDYIIRKFKEISGIKVFISPGNHDPFNSKSFYKVIQWPENVHIFSDHLEKVSLNELGVNVYGIGFSDSYEKEGLIKNFRSNNDVDENMINLMVLHGDVTSGNSEYNPITMEDIAESGMDYIALGHKHEFSGILRAKDTFYAYSGNPEGRGFDECGEKGIIMGSVSKRYADLKFKAISKRQYHVKNIDISGCRDYDEIKMAVMNGTYGEDLYKDLFKIILCGDMPDDFIIKKDIISDKLKEEFFYVKVVDETRVRVDYEDMAGEFSLRGLYAGRMLKAINDEEDDKKKMLLYRALKLGISSLTEKEVRGK